MIWFRVLETWLITRLLASPTFHRGVRHIHKKIHELRHGIDPAEMGGTKINTPDAFDRQKFLKYWKEELRTGFRELTKK